jgi:hypothetical protein
MVIAASLVTHPPTRNRNPATAHERESKSRHDHPPRGSASLPDLDHGATSARARPCLMLCVKHGAMVATACPTT